MDNIHAKIKKTNKDSATIPLAMFGTAVAGGVALFKFYRPNANTTIRMARARILAQGTLIAFLGGMALMGISGSDGKNRAPDRDIDLSRRR
ncbi:hypothetical protein AAMO2058_001518500 [Amorphochlora amoebiformis]|eukprot:1321014-Amorphochlora_amoeboformis.AAC.1